MKNEIRNSWHIKVYNHNRQYISVDIPSLENRPMAIFSDLYNSVEEIDEVLEQILFYRKSQELSPDLGLNNHSLIVNKESCYIDFEFGDFQKCEIKTAFVIQFFEEYRDFLDLYLSGGIPGIIPVKMLDSWRSEK